MAWVGWLPLLGIVALAIRLGVWAAHAPRRLRWATYAAPWVLGAMTVVLVVLSPPCTDLLDGPCELNWVANGVYVTLVLTVFAIVAAATMALASLLRAQVRRRRATTVD